MTIDEQIYSAQIDIDIERQAPRDPDPYVLLNLCQKLLDLIKTVREGDDND